MLNIIRCWVRVTFLEYLWQTTTTTTSRTPGPLCRPSARCCWRRTGTCPSCCSWNSLAFRSSQRCTRWCCWWPAPWRGSPARWWQWHWSQMEAGWMFHLTWESLRDSFFSSSPPCMFSSQSARQLKETTIAGEDDMEDKETENKVADLGQWGDRHVQTTIYQQQ